ncbi:MAG: choice-of-anchor D domain-containing protein [Luteolibacter sp.]|uniref:choice-of-anchor D domain-containing protein n=1 Tax=Luteolibacter sp. TaxID=1962973 RepID=UPI003267A16C
MKIPLPGFALAISFFTTAFALAEAPGTYTPDIKVPEISVRQPGRTELVDGFTKVSFGEVERQTSSETKTFTIKNTGLATLTGLAITRAGANKTLFTVSALGKTSLAPGKTTTFTVKFKPVFVGFKHAVIRISSNDSDENPFDIRVSGVGVKK